MKAKEEPRVGTGVQLKKEKKKLGPPPSAGLPTLISLFMFYEFTKVLLKII
jgi:hypothetical protein